ncbi:MAG: hypothetical protein OIF50_09345 [Flavobacteriaceae bacterium]|nr:hypothetical protein [Flavobacteriaceae bacterium]
MQTSYSGTYFCLQQDHDSRSFLLQNKKEQIRLRFCQLLALRHKLNAIDMEAHFDLNHNPSGIEIVSLCNQQHILLLNTLELIDLKKAISCGLEAPLRKWFHAA